MIDIKNTAMWYERMLEMKISTREGRISGFRKRGSGPPHLGVGKLHEFI
jgi:hypothetical protein